MKTKKVDIGGIEHVIQVDDVESAEPVKSAGTEKDEKSVKPANKAVKPTAK